MRIARVRWWRVTSLGLAIVSLGSAIAIWAVGGVSLTIGSLEITARDPSRAVWVALAALAAYALTSGLTRLHDDVALLRRAARPERLAGLIALGTLLVAIAHNSWVAGGADSYA